MEVICVNDVFPADYQAKYREYGVTTPKKDVLYTVRAVQTHTTGQTGILLNEVVNNPIPVPHPVLGQVMMEPTWNITRFATLLGQPLKKEELVEETVI